MKIAQVVCTIPPYGGGIGTVAHHYAEELVNLGHQVDVFVPCRKNFRENTNYTVKRLIPWLRIGLGALTPQLFWRLRKYDVVHLHFPFFGAAFFVYLLKRWRKEKMKLIISYHMDVTGSGLRKKFFSFYYKHVLTGIINCADKIIVSSYDYVENSNAADYYFKNKGKFIEIPFGVSDKFYPQKKNPSLLEKYKLNPSDSIVGFVGGLDTAHYFKGVNYLITAISKISAEKNVKALIVGGGNLKEEYEALAKKLGIAERVIFCGYVPADILVEHYNLFDVFILPSIDKSEAFGLVLVEAMACGKPLIASNLKGVRSVVIPGENGFLVEPQNPRDIADKIVYLFENKELFRQFGLNGLALANKKYRWPVVAKQVETVYNYELKK